MDTPTNFDPTWTEPSDYTRDADWRELLEADADWKIEETRNAYDREVEADESEAA